MKQCSLLIETVTLNLDELLPCTQKKFKLILDMCKMSEKCYELVRVDSFRCAKNFFTGKFHPEKFFEKSDLDFEKQVALYSKSFKAISRKKFNFKEEKL